MQRRHYVQFAEMIRRQLEPFGTAPQTQRGQLVHGTILEMRDRIADLFAEDNPRFDRVRFLKACEPDA